MQTLIQKESLAELNRLTDKEFYSISETVNSITGITLPYSKKVMVEARLRKRLKELRYNSFTDYYNALFANEINGDELLIIIDLLTTNKTDFMREPNHYFFMRDYVLPEFYEENYNSNVGKFQIWSSACSSGEEVYTLAMFLSEFKIAYQNFDYNILGTDISTLVLQKAYQAIYDEERISVIPIEFKKKYLLRSKDRQKKIFRIVPGLRVKASFKRLNLMDEVLDVDNTFNVIFCRNVLIYFNRDIQQKVISKLFTKLKPGGYLFLGHSETMFNRSEAIIQVGPSIYK
ncbi:MAG: chemotaxis protein CheR, partial [Melioribacteraceae bacterium]